MQLNSEITHFTALAYGLLSFFSGCVLPLIPVYFTFITGTSLDELTTSPNAATRRKVIISTLAFVFGFSTVFILMGATAFYLSELLFTYKPYLRIFGGVLVIIFGLHLLGLFRIRILDYEKRLHISKKPLHIIGVFFVGMAFGAGWSPCIGPMLGSILILASNNDTVFQGMRLLATYSFGLALPFIVLSVAITYLIKFIRRSAKMIPYINAAAGVLLLATGVLLISDKFGWLTFMLSEV
ncbi:MAG: cytochrome c biogenesis protein CcdA [Desulfobacteraceae bacterium]|nr:cytochrome c biogenesis protein CcdA [Desulfobacteraceae bacterium]